MKWITARHLETWAGTTQGPSSLPGLVGALIRATVSDISHYRFPEGDKGRVRGFDGVVETAVTSPFVPDGRSIWEFGAEKAISTKARKDFETRSKEIDEDKRKTMTFVFVTPQTWDTPTVKLHDFVDALKADRASAAIGATGRLTTANSGPGIDRIATHAVVGALTAARAKCDAASRGHATADAPRAARPCRPSR